ncbi:MAG TPA: DMT family transporter [Steroidobacteraceae bacterium]|nr:DMT family transporter [Steroidobacteraceae bacterium]
MTAPGHRIGFALVTASAVAWSTAGLFTRLIHADSWTMLAWRGIFGALGLALVLTVMPRQASWRALRNLGWLGWLFVVQSSAGMIFFLTALRHTSVAHVAVIYATVPFLAAVLSWLAIRERPGTAAVAASAVALVGVVIMVGFGGDGGLSGDLLALGMTLSMAVAMVVARHFPAMPFLPAACMSALLSGVISLPFGAPLSVSAHDFMLLLLFGLTTFAIGLPLFTLGARLLPAVDTALIGSLEAPLAPLWVWLAFAETPSAGTLLGGSIVLAAVAMHLVLGSATALPKPAVAE